MTKVMETDGVKKHKPSGMCDHEEAKKLDKKFLIEIIEEQGKDIFKFTSVHPGDKNG